MPTFHIRLASDDLAFCAGHFLVFEGGQCERLHGHSFRVAAEVFGPLDANQYVVDFVAAQNALKAIVAELDHRMLLPTKHPAIGLSSRSGEIEATFAGRRWIFPEGDCLLLPIANTTTELLAQHVAERFWTALIALGGGSPERVRVEIGEGCGASAVCELP
jgi:6-pyruvoyltetrahydropterin/6-carboxytetrahydropterin synthase